VESKPENLTALLRAWSAGDHAAFDELMPVLHREQRTDPNPYTVVLNWQAGLEK